MSWINDGSHSISDALFIEIEDEVIGKYLKVFKEIFYKTNHGGHYEMMMGINTGDNNEQHNH